MKVALAHRRYGVHEHVKEAEVPGDFADYATLADESRGEYAVSEDKLIAALPAGFLPVPPGKVLLVVADGNSGTGQAGLSRFRNWAKYFDSWVLDLVKADPEPPAAGEDRGPDPVQLGTEACRALMRELDGYPVLLETPAPGDPLNRLTEATAAGQRERNGTWCVVLVPTLDMVSVRAQLAMTVLGWPDLAILSPGEDRFKEYIYVRYPQDTQQVAGPQYAARLRDAVLTAAAAVAEGKPDARAAR